MTPFELDTALKDNADYISAYPKQVMELQRFIGTVMRNKGLKQNHQLRDPRKFYTFPWDEKKDVHIPTREEWKKLDQKYKR